MELTYLNSLNTALFELFDNNKNVYLIGEDLLDPYGGAFKVSKGLSMKFNDRIITTPISEACIIGIGAGMALRGLKPIVEIMFGDFITLAADQIINHIAKLKQMYNGKVKVPVVIRTPMGGGRGYGPTHSQSLEKIFLGIPGLKIISPSHFHEPGLVLKHIINKENDPIIFIEHKSLYPLKLITKEYNGIFVEYEFNKNNYPIAIVKNYFDKKSPDIIIISYGGMSSVIENVLRDFLEEEIYIVSIFLCEISNPSIEFVSKYIFECGKILIIEEGAGYFGWNAEIASRIYENYGNYLQRPIKRISSFNSVIPAAKHLENKVLPNKESIEKLIEETLL